MNDDFKSQLTALALEELPAEARASVLARVAEQPDARAYFDGTSEFCDLLTRSLAVSEESSLTDGQRAELARRLVEPEVEVVAIPPRRRGTWASWTMGLGAAAAAVLVANHLWHDRNDSTVVMAPTVPPPPQAGADRFEGLFFGGGLPGGGGGVDAAKPGLASPDDGLSDMKKEMGAGLGYSAPGGLEKPRASLSRVLADEPQSTTARQQLEEMDRPSNEQLLAARDRTRAEALGEVDGEWESSVAEPASTPAGALLDASDSSDGSKRVRGAEAAGAAGNAPLGTGSGAMLAGRASGAEPADKAGAENTVDTLAATPEAQGPQSLSEPVALAASAPATGSREVMETKGSALFTQVQGDAAAGGVPAVEGGESLALSDGGTVSEPHDGFRFTTPPAGREARLYDLETMPQSTGEVLAKTKSDFVAEERLSRMDARASAPSSAEAYEEVPENPFLAVAAAPLSTFSIDVDTASYANVRRFLNQGQRPPKAAVRLEEMINYFRYDYPQPAGEAPFSITVDMADCPWQPQHRLARIGLQGKTIAREERPSANLVFLVDVSGSMDEPNKLPLVRQSLHLLTSQLKGSDHVAIVTYAGQSGVALPSTSLEQKEIVTGAIDSLAAGGSTNGASGIQLAYQQARQNFKKEGVNRVLLTTDGDFNVGLTSREDLDRLITSEAKSGVFLSVLGYGMGNLKDATMESLADKGNGNYGYIDSLSEARKVLGDQLEGTLHTIAKDVKIQIEFNPAQVRHYRLLGYENRLLAKEDFNDDTKDAGEIGAGHTVTALYEIVPADAPPLPASVDPLKYQPAPPVVAAVPAADQPVSRESMTVKLRYKAPQGTTSQLIEVPVVDSEKSFAEAPADFKFATSVALTGLLLKDSAHKGTAHWNMVRDFARAGKGPDPEGYRGEFLQLVEKAAGVAP